MGINLTELKQALQPNFATNRINDLYVDAGDPGRLSALLSRPQTCLVYGERGAGKSLLFEALKIELTGNMAKYYKNKTILSSLRGILLHNGKGTKTPRIPVFLRVTSGGNREEILFNFVHGVIRQTVKSLLFARMVSNKNLFKDREAELAGLLARLEEKEISKLSGGRIGVGFNIGGAMLPITLEKDSSEEYSESLSAKPIQELRTLHAVGEDLLGIVNKEGIELVIALDEFDKISVDDSAYILRKEQGPLFEALRPNFSFLLPASSDHVTELEKPEYLGVFTDGPFRLNPFDKKYAKEMINKRLDFYRAQIGSKMTWKDVVGDNKLEEICNASNHVPRLIMKKLHTEVSNHKKLPIN